MKKQTWPNWLVYLVSVGIALAVGALAALLTAEGMRAYATINKPPLSPPAVVFPLVWTALFVLMGVSAARVYLAGGHAAGEALRVYALQLFLNFGWTVLYFGFGLYLAAFVWLLILEAVIVVMLASFYAVDRPAGLLQIPYAVWVAFAGYLNLATYLLNG